MGLSEFRGAIAARYRIERELGRGGMATVFLAHDLKHDRPVALKLLHPELAAVLGGERFQREIMLAARLQHPHILAVHDSGETAGNLWFTMPYVDGESLRQRLEREGSLPFEETLRITREIADALDYAHGRGIIHRDIKPENILLSGGHALVADFGIARSLGEERHLTGTGIAVGTPAYMSPEQATADRHIDARTDVYALGCVVHEMLTGKTPGRGGPQTGRSRAVDAALAKALAPAPADRFAAAGDFARALSKSETMPSRRRRQVIAAVAVLALFGVLWGGYVWRTSRRPLVIMMDSPHPDRVYDVETIRASGTNADVISDILADLPIVRQKETGGPGWHRYDEMLAFHPDLIIMHYSTFRGSDSGDARPGLKTFLSYFAERDRDTRFLIYTRSRGAEIKEVVDSLMADVEVQHPGLLARITFFGTPDHGGGPHWRDPVTAGELKLAVKRILGLE